ncbi:zinc finger protein [Decorospora gaudefroyi]|uniref:RING-type E3 ubiquitin transferase n=1 Tax=Decorospora gaudefroyi TaxID=184978 RepID=A0A6A5K6M4_9PLEO|nr:zinc finger protein [Decorospora gaudefroyi]
MEQPSNQNATSQSQRPAHRDMMFCHECNDEWYRDEHGLSCPECGSDFTEIIEDNNDPRNNVMFGHDGDDSDSLPDLEDAPSHVYPRFNPWQSDDPEEGDISNVSFVQTAPGRYNLQATVTRSVSPQGGMAPGSIGGFMAMLSGLAGSGLRPQGQQQGQPQGQPPGQPQGQPPGQPQGQPPGQGEGLFSGAGPNPNQPTSQGSQSPGAAGGPRVTTGRFTYNGGARLFPRDGNNAGPVEDELANVMTGLMAALGAPPPHVHAQNHPQGGAQGTFHGEHTHEHGTPFAGNPILQLFSTMGMLGPGAGNMGDFVYSQEGLDRIVSQLMEQTATSNAPGPATQADIDALPHKEVSEDMLGDEHKAECSICMDEVNIGEQVTVLPCKHWFHHQCVSAWLLEHDTCPHCRKGITKGSEGQENGPSASSRTDRTSQMPSSFNPSGSGSASDPYFVSGSPAPPSNNRANSSDNANTGSGNGGISDRIRRGLFGSPQ